MKKALFLLLLIALPIVITAQEISTPEPEIGVVEHLGDTIPLDLWFFNELNDTVTLGQLVDKPTIFSFVYFDCPGLCSPLMSGISDMVDDLDLVLGEDYQIITISFNTKDTPEKAKEKKDNFVQNISEEHQKHWIFLTGVQENILEITSAVGYKYKPQGVDFAHPSLVIMVSPQGKITRYLYGLTFLPFDVKMAIVESQKGLARPTINRILEVCFTYNSNSRTYTLAITSIVGAIMIFGAVVTFIVLLIKGRKKQVKK